ncbi:hypothetical protein LJC51_07485 [Lachnospiraceae bacterium OttesenSCG-928-J05]|nr:hypothetical protein [Lachnospiraceae bacterium OttesenSCG-928-J05]
MRTLGQLREITKHLPDDFEIKVEASFTPVGNKVAPCFEIITSQKSKEVVIMPQSVFISDGKTSLKAGHPERGVER